MKAHANVEVMKVNVDRGAFTEHGQHMNATGKEVMAKKTAESIMHTMPFFTTCSFFSFVSPVLRLKNLPPKARISPAAASFP
jgi:hypothetical protein